METVKFPAGVLSPCNQQLYKSRALKITTFEVVFQNHLPTSYLNSGDLVKRKL